MYCDTSALLVQGLEYHKFYFDHFDKSASYRTTIHSPTVKVLDSVAIISYSATRQVGSALDVLAVLFFCGMGCYAFHLLFRQQCVLAQVTSVPWFAAVLVCGP